MLMVKATVTNQGKSAVYRLKGISQSDHSLMREREFLFGKIEPGKKVSRQVKIRLPYFPRAQSNLFSLDLSASSQKIDSTNTAVIEIKGRQRPAFSYNASLTDTAGKKVLRLGESASANLRLRITNSGKGTAHKGIAVLRNKSGKRIFLQKGRVEFLKLKAGKSTDIQFEFKTVVDEDAKKNAADYEFELTIYDAYSSGVLKQNLSISQPGEEGKDFPNGREFSAPGIRLSLLEQESRKSVLVTRDREIELQATVSSDSDEFSSWATNQSLSQRYKTPDKIFFDRSRGKKSLNFTTRVQLREGLNLVSVYAKSPEGIESYRSVVIRKED